MRARDRRLALSPVSSTLTAMDRMNEEAAHAIERALRNAVLDLNVARALAVRVAPGSVVRGTIQREVLRQSLRVQWLRRGAGRPLSANIG